MVGFLIAGFAYNMAGLAPPAGLDTIANLGITLLLFSIGLKLDVRGLLKAEIWSGATTQMLFSIAFMCGAFLLVREAFGASLLDVSMGTILLLSFAFSFSSTVFAVKVLEDKGDMSALYGRIAIGLLIMQDLFAVLFLSLTAGKIPSIWALGLIGLPLVRPVLYRLLDLAGHGELFVLSGLFIALGLGAELFSLVGMKADLGALVVGVLLAGYHRASELSYALFSFKELMLVGFFLSIGMTGLPTMEMLLAAFLLCLLLPFKTGIYYFVISLFGLRARTNLFASLTLTNYSEFGLIVAAIAVGQGLLSSEWLMIAAMAVSISFALSAPLSMHAEHVYRLMQGWLCKFERKTCHPLDAPIDPGSVRAMVIGMGRIGMGAYDELLKTYSEDDICGVEHNPSRVDSNRAQGRNVLLGDACDTDFWLKLRKDLNLEIVILAMPKHQGNMFAARQLLNYEIECRIAAIAHYQEEVEELSRIGVCSAFNMYERAGAGLVRIAFESCKLPEYPSRQGGESEGFAEDETKPVLS